MCMWKSWFGVIRWCFTYIRRLLLCFGSTFESGEGNGWLKWDGIIPNRRGKANALPLVLYVYVSVLFFSLRMLCALVCLLRSVCASVYFVVLYRFHFSRFDFFFYASSSLYLSRALHCIVRITKYTHNTKNGPNSSALESSVNSCIVLDACKRFNVYVYIYMA